MRLIDIDPIIERLKNAIYLGKRIGEDTANMEAVLADVEAAPTYNDDLISRQAAIEALKRAEALTRAFGYHNVIETIRELPTAEPEPSQVARDIATIIENEQDMRVILSHPKKGKWIDYCGGVKCDQCGFECDDTYYLDEANFCPNCGARMEENE